MVGAKINPAISGHRDNYRAFLFDIAVSVRSCEIARQINGYATLVVVNVPFRQDVLAAECTADQQERNRGYYDSWAHESSI
jgi:hypothetical protein